MYDEHIDHTAVALFTRAWIEIFALYYIHPAAFVALFTRAWIEISVITPPACRSPGRPLYEGVD